MESKFGKIIPFCLLVTSCVFDRNPIEVVGKIDEHYYVTWDNSAPGYGFILGWASDSSKGGLESMGVATNCVEIYYNADTILFGKIFFEGSDTAYYVLPINPKREDGFNHDPIKIGKNVFRKRVVRLQQFKLPKRNIPSRLDESEDKKG